MQGREFTRRKLREKEDTAERYAERQEEELEDEHGNLLNQSNKRTL